MQVSNEHSDVIVIGAGPAGLLAAHQLGNQSMDTIILEEHSQIGVPTSCAGLISVSGLARLGIQPPESVILNRVQGAMFYSPSGKSITSPFGVKINNLFLNTSNLRVCKKSLES